MRSLAWVILAGAPLVLGGCAGYRLGPTGGQSAGAKSISVSPFLNQTMQPRLGDAVTSALRKEIQRDGTFTLATREQGDIVVSGLLTDYDRQARSFEPADVITPRDYRVSLTAHVTARERSTGKVLLDRTLTGHTFLRATSDLNSADRQALPLLATDLGRQVAQLLADGSW